ncbi:MAG: polymerase subunit gamma/tau [Chloroflexi bacterium]|nr:polymerase subunit gamma/tau [Chloroflexota bacterium]
MTAPAGSPAGSGHPPGQKVLYLRWRPGRFADVIGQDAISQTLKNAVARGTLAHGYLLCGPRGVGKTSLARILYKALNCLDSREGDSCGVCASCQAADAGRAMDLIEIDAASNRGIDDIRALRERVRFAPVEARFKVYIVDEAHQLTAAAWDAFLKTLEEPPPNTVFVLATTAAHKVPATIVSRCQRFDLGRISHGEICAHLDRVAKDEGIELESGVADRLARLARGGLRDALSLLEQVAAFSGSPVTLDGTRRVLGLARGDALRSFVDALAYRDCQRAFVVLEDVAREGADLRQFLDELLGILRAALLIRAGAEAAISSEHSEEEMGWLRASTQHWSPGEIAELLESYGSVQTSGGDEQQLLVQLELATAVATESANSLLEPTRPPPSPNAFGPTLAPPATSLIDDRAAFVASTPSTTTPEVAAPQMAPLSATEPFSVDSRSPSAPSDDGLDPPSHAKQPMLSLVSIEARWPAILERYQGSVLNKVLVSRLMPVRLEDGVVTFGGKLAALEVRRLDIDCRRALEAAIAAELEIEMKVEFRASDEPTRDLAYDSLADYAASLFGGQLVEAADQ